MGYISGAGQGYPPDLGCAELDPEISVVGCPFENGGAAVVLVDPRRDVGRSQTGGSRAHRQVGAVAGGGAVAGAGRGGRGANVVAG